MWQPQSFGMLLKRHRVAAGLTQEALAEQAHLSARAISDLERGVNQTPRHDTVRLLAAALGLSAQERAAFEAAARPSKSMAPPLIDPATPSPPASSRQPTAGGLADDTPPLVGRARELALLERHLAGKGPPVLLLAGEPGIGKSRLLQEAARRAVVLGWRVLADGCQRRGGEPYAPLLGALQRHLADQEPLHLRAELAGCAWLVRLLPELADGPIEPLPAWTLPPEQERRLMFAAVGRFLANVAGPAGTLLLLDDLQWAGSDALHLLATLVRSTAEMPLRVVGAYRDTEVQPQDPLAVLLADLAHAGLVVHRTLAPLTPQEAGELLDGLLEGMEDDHTALRARVLQRAGGVPFFLLSCVQGLRLDEGEGSVEDAVPWDVAQGIRQRVAALPAAAREVLGVAAVAGRVVQPALLRAGAERADREVVAALDAACRARLLVEQGQDAYAFAHDVIREVVEADLGAARRLLLHQRVAETLERAPGEPPVEALAYHYSRSGVQEKAVLYLEQAGDKAQAQAAHAAAEGHYRELVDRLEKLGRALDAARVREKLGAVLRIMVRYDAALAVLEEAAQTYQAVGDLERLAYTLAQIGRVYVERGTFAEGLQRLQPLVERLESGGTPHSRAALAIALARLYHQCDRHEEKLAAAEQAAALARTIQDERLLAPAEMLRAAAHLNLGHLDEALGVAEEVIPRAESIDDLDILSDALQIVGMAHSYRGEFATGWPYLERALAAAQRWGDPAQIAWLTGLCGLSAFWRGAWNQARGYVEQAADLSRQIGASWVSACPLLLRGYLCLAEGAWEEASQDLEEATLLAERRSDVYVLPAVQSALAERDLRKGHPDAVRVRLVPLLEHRPQETWTVTTPGVLVLAWAQLELGEVVQAAEATAQMITRARAANNRLVLVDALWIQAMVAIRQGCWAEAEQALEEGLALARRMPYPYAEARLLHVYGEMHRQKGEAETARERLESALAIFQRLGARWDGELTAEAIADLDGSER